MAAYTILHYFLLIGIGAFLYLVFAYITDIFGYLQQIFLDNFAGIITEQTIMAGNFIIGIIIATPIIIAVALTVWAFVRGGSTS